MTSGEGEERFETRTSNSWVLISIFEYTYDSVEESPFACYHILNIFLTKPSIQSFCSDQHVAELLQHLKMLKTLICAVKKPPNHLYLSSYLPPSFAAMLLHNCFFRGLSPYERSS